VSPLSLSKTQNKWIGKFWSYQNEGRKGICSIFCFGSARIQQPPRAEVAAHLPNKLEFPSGAVNLQTGLTLQYAKDFALQYMGA
jgi:hypothetical protein